MMKKKYRVSHFSFNVDQKKNCMILLLANHHGNDLLQTNRQIELSNSLYRIVVISNILTVNS